MKSRSLVIILMFVAVLVFVPTSSAFAQSAAKITDLSATAGVGEITLSWTAPNLNGGEFVQYDIFYEGGDATEEIREYSTTSSTITFPNITPQTFTIRTQTSGFFSPQSDAVTITPLAPQLPSQITDLRVVAVSDEEITLAWTAPDLNGGTFRHYEILFFGGDGSLLVRDHSTISTTFNNPNNLQIPFTIRTVTTAGTSLESDVVIAAAFDQLPSRITDLRAIVGDGTVALTWTAPDLNGGTFVAYEISDGGVSENIRILDHSTTSKIITLPNDERHAFTIRTETSLGFSSQSNIETVTPIVTATPLGLPSQIIDLKAVAYDGGFTLTWTAPDLNGGTFENYEIFFLNGNSELVRDHSTTSKIIKNPNNLEFIFTISTTTDLGTSVLSDAVTSMYSAPQLPSPITDLRAVAGVGTITLTWTVPDLNGGTFNYYEIYYDGGDATEEIREYSTTSRTFTFPNVVPQTFTIRTETSSGLSAQSNAITATPLAPTVTPIATPSPIIDLRAVAGVGEIALSWTAPNLNGGTFVSYYIYNGDGDIIETISDHSTTSKTFAFPNVASQSFSIRTETSSGLGSRSNTVTATPLAPTATPFTQTGNGTIATVIIVSSPITPNFTFTFERINLNSSFDLSTRGIVDDTDAFADLEILICNISSPVNTTSGLSTSSVNKLEETNCREVTDKNALVFNLSSTNGIPQTVAYIVTDSDNLSSKGNITFAIVDESNNPPTAPDFSFRLEAGLDHVIDFIAEGVTDDNTNVSDLVITLTGFENVFDIYVEFLSGINEMSYVVTDENKQVTIGTTSSALSGFGSQDVMYSVTDSEGQSSTGTISFDITKAKPVLSGVGFTATLPYGLDAHTIAVSPRELVDVLPSSYQISLVIGLNTTSTTTEGGTIEIVYGKDVTLPRPPFTVIQGVIEEIVYTPPRQNFVGTDQITLKGSVTADGVTTSKESTLNFVVLAPQCSSQVGDSIAFGDQTEGETSDEQRLDISNTGDISSNIFLKGTDWIDGTDRSVMDIGQTRYSGTESSDFTSKTQLSNSNVSFDDNLESGTVGTAYLQLLLDLLVTGFTGEATQTITVVTSCDL